MRRNTEQKRAGSPRSPYRGEEASRAAMLGSTLQMGGAVFSFLLRNSFIYGTIVLSVDSRTVKVRTTLASASVSPGIFGCSGLHRREKTTGLSTCHSGQVGAIPAVRDPG